MRHALAEENVKHCAWAGLKDPCFQTAHAAPAFWALNQGRVRSAAEFAPTMSDVPMSFNWLYVDGSDIAYFKEEIQIAEHEIVALMRHSGDGAGDDQADAGAKTFEREQEMSLANNAREMLIQSLHAIELLDLGNYGICESCGEPIGKPRLEAAPRATLCLSCKSKQERR